MMDSIIGAARGQGGQGAGQGDAGAVVKDASMQTFAKDVLEASMAVPVLVDFWAPWCGPCKQLTPMLEKLVRAAGGAIRLVKVNVDENQMLAQQLRIQSLPTVMAFKAGRPIDGFQGALPESQLKQFIGALVGGEQARLGDLDGARETLAAVPPSQANHADVLAATAALTLAEETATAKDTEPLLEILAQNPDDHQTRYDLALSLTKAGAFDAAADALLEIVRRDRAWNEDAARKQLVKMFEAFGQTSPFTVAARRKLSSLLFS